MNYSARAQQLLVQRRQCVDLHFCCCCCCYFDSLTLGNGTRVVETDDVPFYAIDSNTIRIMIFFIPPFFELRY
jgi:hypothetical protein